MGVRNWRPLLHINSGMAKIEDHQEIEDRHAKILAAVQPLSRNFPSKNLTQIDLQTINALKYQSFSFFPVRI